MIKGTQICVARILLGLTQEELAKLCNVSVSTIRRVEGKRTGTHGLAETVDAIQTALEKKSVKFINSDGKTGVEVKDEYVSARNLRSEK